MKKLILGASIASALMLTGCVAGTTISLPSDTYFATDSATIKPSAQHSIREAAGRIHRNILTINHIIVEGNTDNVGNASYNVQLSQRRAQAVANELSSYGVPSRMISVRGNGEAKPVASNSTQIGRAQNRRVDIIVQGSILLP